MPIYEYQCRACGHVFDALQKASDDPLRDCPDCGKPELKKALSAPRFRLKGKGWYETDFKTGEKRNLDGDGGKDAAADKDSKDGKGGKEAAADKSDKKQDAKSSKKSDASSGSSKAAEG